MQYRFFGIEDGENDGSEPRHEKLGNNDKDVVYSLSTKILSEMELRILDDGNTTYEDNTRFSTQTSSVSRRIVVAISVNV